MLLVVTLIAACLGWRSAINYEEASDKARIRRVRLFELKRDLLEKENSLAIKESRLQSSDPSERNNAAFSLTRLKIEIPKMKKEIAELSK